LQKVCPASLNTLSANAAIQKLKLTAAQKKAPAGWLEKLQELCLEADLTEVQKLARRAECEELAVTWGMPVKAAASAPSSVLFRVLAHGIAAAS
jgi:hypothetical protein